MAKCPLSRHVDVLISCMYLTGVGVGVQMSRFKVALSHSVLQYVLPLELASVFLIFFLWSLHCTVFFPMQEAAMIKA